MKWINENSYVILFTGGIILFFYGLFLINKIFGLICIGIFLMAWGVIIHKVE